MQFVKMHGAGNDYVYLDCFQQPVPENPSRLATAISDRHTGVGADGLILICPSARADASMRMFNADGSESGMCGNGIRCVGKYLYDRGIVRSREIRVETGAGILALELETKNGRVCRATVDMGEPQLQAQQIPTTLPDPLVDVELEVAGRVFHVTCVSLGNPHCVVFAEEVDDELVQQFGPLIERDPRFPARTNVEFVRWINPERVVQRTWERGSGETMACGSGACAVCVAGVLTERTGRSITSQLLGGELQLRWDENNRRVYMTGPAVEVFTGEWML